MGWMLPYFPSLNGVNMSVGSLLICVCGRSSPDHELVITGVGDVVDVRSSEQIVRNIGVNVAGAGAPSDRSRDTVDAADQLLRECELIGTMVSLVSK